MAPDSLELALDEATWWMGHPFTHALTELAHAREATIAMQDDHHEAALAVLRHVFQVGAIVGERERLLTASALFSRAGLGTLEFELPAARSSGRGDRRLRARGRWLHGMLAAAEASATGVALASDGVAAAFVAALDDALTDRAVPTARTESHRFDGRHGAELGFECSLGQARVVDDDRRAVASTRDLCRAELSCDLNAATVDLLVDRLRPDRNGVIQGFGMLAARRFATADLRTIARLCATQDPMVNSAVREIARSNAGTMLWQIWDSPERGDDAEHADAAQRLAAGCALLRGLRWGHLWIVEMRSFKTVTVAVPREWSSRVLRRSAPIAVAWAQGCALGLAEYAHGVRSAGRASTKCRVDATDTSSPSTTFVTIAIG